MGRGPWLLVAVAILATVAQSSAANGEEGATSAEERLVQARELMGGRQVRAAIPDLVGVATDEGSTAAERVTAYELLAAALVRIRRVRDARQAIERLLDLDPGHELQERGLPRQLRVLYRQTRRRYEPQVDLQVTTHAPGGFSREEPATVEATARGTTWGVDRAVAHLRPEGADAFREEPMIRSGLEFRLQVEPPSEEGGLEYFVEVLAPSGYVLGSRGSEAAPLLIAGLPPLPVHHWYASWWFWTLVGAVVAGATTAGVLLTLPEHQDGTLGSMEAP